MAKNNNLTDFLTDVANAIRSKKGTTAKINPQDFSSEIASISTEGGGGNTEGAVSKSDVNFYDYDGTLLHSYSKSAFLALSALPNLPTREGLTCQEWNYNLEDAKEYVNECGVLDVGATYITDDGKTRLYIKIAAPGRMDVPLYFSQTVSDGVTIDWGDGSATQTITGTSNVNTTHKYDKIGDYIITLNPKSGCTLGLGHNSSSYCVMGKTGSGSTAYCSMLQKVEIGNGVTKIDSYAFYSCYQLSFVVIPNSVTSILANAFYYSQSLSSVVIPNSVTNIGQSAFSTCSTLSSIFIPKSVRQINNSVFASCSSLSSVVIPNSVTNIGKSSITGCYAMASILIPKSVSGCSDYAFDFCYGMAYYDFSQHTTIPGIGSNTFKSIPSDCKIIVPDNLYDSWIAATNWSSHASKIIKKSDWDAQNN